MQRSPFPGICAMRGASGAEKLNRTVAASPVDELGWAQLANTHKEFFTKLLKYDAERKALSIA